jgi:Uma2 family endonuclease
MRSSEHAVVSYPAEEEWTMSMATVRRNSGAWTLDELHRLPDDGNKYEVLRGELFVTPAPAVEHEIIAARLARLLEPYVERNALGLVFRPRAIVRVDGSEVEPDLMVRRLAPDRSTKWEDQPAPSLVVEIVSPTTRRRDREEKREFYLDVGIAEYWIIDPERKEVSVVRRGEPDREEREVLVWHPDGAATTLSIAIAELFA